MAKKVEIDIKLNDEATKPLNNVGKASDSLRNQIRVLKEQMAEMLANGVKPMSEEFQQLAKRAGELQDAMGDANAIVNDFASDTHNIDMYTSSVETMVAAYGLYQSAAQMMGVEDEKLEEGLKNLMAAQTALNSVQKISNQLKAQSTGLYKLLHYEIVTYTGASKSATVATKAFNIGLKALGIGLVISAVALLVEHWEDLVGWVKKSTPELADIGKVFDQVKAVAFGLGNAIMQFVITPIRSMIKVFNDLKDGEFKKALEDFSSITKEQFNNILNFGKNFEEGYTAELQSQSDKRKKIIDKAAAERIAKEKETLEKMRELNDAYNADFAKEMDDEYKEYSDNRKKYYTDELNYEKESRKLILEEFAAYESQEEGDSFVDELLKKQEKWIAHSKKVNEAAKNTKDVMSGVGSVFSTLGGAMDNNAGAMISWAGDTISAIAQVIPQIVSLITAKQGEATASATAAGSGVPFPGNIIAMATGLAAVTAAFMKIPKFADGGIAYGPTLGLFGEYAGASNNPEIVAPLDKLKGMIATDNEGAGGIVKVKIEGRDLVGILEKESSYRRRS